MNFDEFGMELLLPYSYIMRLLVHIIISTNSCSHVVNQVNIRLGSPKAIFPGNEYILLLRSQCRMKLEISVALTKRNVSMDYSCWAMAFYIMKTTANAF